MIMMDDRAEEIVYDRSDDGHWAHLPQRSLAHLAPSFVYLRRRPSCIRVDVDIALVADVLLVGKLL